MEKFSNNRLLDENNARVMSALFSGSTIVGDPINSFYDVQSIKSEITRYVDLRVKEAKREGAREVLSKLKAIAHKETNEYIQIVTQIVETVIRMVDLKNKEPKADLKVVDSRTSFDFIGKEIKVIFIIDAGVENEKEFSDLLNELTRIVFIEENYLAELLYVNARGAKLDMKSISSDFPSVRDTEKAK